MSNEKRDDPRCDHQGFIHRVSNIRDGDDWVGRPVRSTWVCGERACTLDAQAWALRTGEPEVFTYAHRGHECNMCEPVAVPK